MKLYLRRRKKLLKKLFLGLGFFVIGFLLLMMLSLSEPGSDVLRPSQIYLFLSLMCICVIAAYKPLDFAISLLFRNWLFKNKSNTQFLLMHLAEELETVLNLHELGNLVVNTFGEVLHLKTVALYASRGEGRDYEVVSTYGWSLTEARKSPMSLKAAIMELISSHGQYVLVRDKVIRAMGWKDATRLSHDFNALRASWVVPVYRKLELVGFLAFSAADTESIIFDGADFQFFKEFASKIAAPLRNALRVDVMQEEIKKLQDEQSELVQTTKQEAIEQLASGIAHEIHNPLAIISGKAQILLLKKDKMGISPQVEEMLKAIVTQTQRASDIARKLLMFSQGGGEPPEPLNLVQILQDTIALISYQTSIEGIRITSAFHGDIPFFEGNVHEIREVFFNLILNAVQSLQEKGGKIHCEINYLEREKMIEFFVLDTGPGIPKESIQKLFNPFFTTRHENVGLGLFVTKQIVHRYGGTVRVESRLGEGSLFLVLLPCRTPRKAGKEQETAMV